MPLTIQVLNSDLALVPEPLLIGHYASLGLTGSEAAMDRLLEGRLARSLRAGAYPQQLGSSKIFQNLRSPPNKPWHLPRPQAVVVVGLGSEGALRPQDLLEAVYAGIVSWALDVYDRAPGTDSLKIATTLIGSGGLNISAGQAAQLIAQAVMKANDRLLDLDQAGDGTVPPLIDKLVLVDLYLDRAADAWRSLRELEASSGAAFVLEERIDRSDNALDRPIESSYRGSDYDLIVATWDEGDGDGATLSYRLDTRRARSEVRAQATQIGLLQQMLAAALSGTAPDGSFGRALFRLLVPLEMSSFLSGGSATLLELDLRAAAIPWELLEPPRPAGSVPRLPWAIRSSLLRKLRSQQNREHVEDAPADAGVLVIGEPACPVGYLRLPGARREARAIVELFSGGSLGGRVDQLIAEDDPNIDGPSGPAVIGRLLDRPWHIVHLSGHGEAACASHPGGMVLSGGAFLGPREIQNMQPVPALVFVNCCFSGAHSLGAPAGEGKRLALADAPSFAANFADQLIAIGVRCVIATGWAVEDGPAEVFANTFYQALLQGQRFIDAVAAARLAAHGEGGCTWAAYQCYGDPDWRLRTDAPDAQKPASQGAPPAFSQVASVPGLLLALRTLVVRARYQGERGEPAQQSLRALEDKFAPPWGERGDVAEAFGRAWLALGDRTQALRWFERASTANDGGASLQCVADLFNLRARTAAEEFARFTASMPAPPASEGGDSPMARAHARAVAEIESALARLRELAELAANSERASLCASASKRLAQVHLAAGRPALAAACIQDMRTHYQRAWELAGPGPSDMAFYPAMNLLAAAVATGASWDEALAAQVGAQVAECNRSQPDFWSVVAVIELRLWELLARQDLAQHLRELEKAFADLHGRVADTTLWSSVFDQTRFLTHARQLLEETPSREEASASAKLLSRLAAFAHPA